MTTKQTAKEHQAADARCGREWECQCGACNTERGKTTPAASASRHTPLIDELAIQLGGVAYEISEGHTSEAGEALDEAIETHTRLAAEIAALRELARMVVSLDCESRGVDDLQFVIERARAALAGKAAAFGPWTLADSQTYAAKVAAGKAVQS